MANIEGEVITLEEVTVPVKRSIKRPVGGPKKGPHGVPRDPNLLLGIIRMHLNKKSWRQIGMHYKISHGGARYYYLKWIRWALSNKEWEWKEEERQQVNEEIKNWIWE